MTEWTRRSVLAALGLSPAALACRPAMRRRAASAPKPEPFAAALAAARELVAALHPRFADAYAHIDAGVRHVAIAEADGAHYDALAVARVEFVAVTAAGAVHRRRADALDPRALAAAVADWLPASAQPRVPAAAAPRVQVPAPGRATGDWLDRAADLHRRARRHGGSRIVYRAAYVDVRDHETAVVRADRERVDRRVRARAGVAFFAALGAAHHVERAERIAGGDVDAAIPDDAALAAAAATALSLVTARPAPDEHAQVVMDPSAWAHVAAGAIAPALDARAWRGGLSAAAARAGARLAPDWLSIEDDPTLAGGYASYAFDERGADAEPTAWIERGVLRGPMERRPSNVVTRGGTLEDPDAAIAAIDDGYLVESAEGATVDLRSWRIAVRAARARHIRGGKFSGRLHGPVALVADVPSLLASVANATSASGAVAVRDVAAIAPHVVARARVARSP
ncbi:MAG: hypothetical protein D6689_14375 [Deltaproteobacteria bacterium]|nr:MAG: hypothetical protein D6689_14375 [Deltaproteobacteria bacterium]